MNEELFDLNSKNYNFNFDAEKSFQIIETKNYKTLWNISDDNLKSSFKFPELNINIDQQNNFKFTNFAKNDVYLDAVNQIISDLADWNNFEILEGNPTEVAYNITTKPLVQPFIKLGTDIYNATDNIIQNSIPSLESFLYNDLSPINLLVPGFTSIATNIVKPLQELIIRGITDSNPFLKMYGNMSKEELSSFILNKGAEALSTVAESALDFLGSGDNLKIVDLDGLPEDITESIPDSNITEIDDETSPVDDTIYRDPNKMENPISLLVKDLPDFFKNMYTLFFKVNTPKKDKHHHNLNRLYADKDVDYFAVNLSGITLPTKSLETEEINFQNVKIPKIKSEVKFERKVSVSFRLDESLYLLKELAQGSYDFSIMDDITEKGNLYLYNVFGNLTKRRKTDDSSLEIIVRIDDSDYIDGDEKISVSKNNSSNTIYGYPERVIYYVLQDCRILGNKNNVAMNQNDANTVEVSFDITFKHLKKYIADKHYYTYNDTQYKDNKEFSYNRGMIYGPNINEKFEANIYKSKSKDNTEKPKIKNYKQNTSVEKSLKKDAFLDPKKSGIIEFLNDILSSTKEIVGE